MTFKIQKELTYTCFMSWEKQQHLALSFMTANKSARAESWRLLLCFGMYFFTAWFCSALKETGAPDREAKPFTLWAPAKSWLAMRSPSGNSRPASLAHSALFKYNGCLAQGRGEGASLEWLHQDLEGLPAVQIWRMQHCSEAPSCETRQSRPPERSPHGARRQW